MTIQTFLLPKAVKPGRIILREPTPVDAPEIGQLLYEASARPEIARGFEPDFPSIGSATALAARMIDDPLVYAIAAVNARRIVGVCFLSEGDPIRGVGPFAVHPDMDGRGIGRALMYSALARSSHAAGVRAIRDSFCLKTLALFTLLGFRVREPLLHLKGSLSGEPRKDRSVRPMTPADLRSVDDLARRLIGFPRGSDVRRALSDGTPYVVEEGRRLTGYATSLNDPAIGHALAETDDDFEALVLGVNALDPRPLNFLLPAQQSRLLRLCLRQGMQAVKPMTLMSRGAYADPQGVYVPSLLY